MTFILESVMMCSVSIALGCMLGIVAMWIGSKVGISIFEGLSEMGIQKTLYTKVDLSNIPFVMTISIIFSAVVAVFPVIKIFNLKITQALRG